ncbi:GAF domain-containing protein [Spirosoma taeanense]|uniref:GAF domain-containing protein n=1 Tax=Spirosoma taeanense TaxID=2735870 RepID=A0A6M5Y845_9BACT|nr:GAF domain-containing protein [Spirosoma taeanense]QJW89664.1 GAF domain-containing protein [Spirosoma taeanense]
MTIIESLPAAIDALLAEGHLPGKTLDRVVGLVGSTLNADRCFLYIRQPDRQRGRIAFCWRQNEEIPNFIQPNWQPDTTDLPQEDPLIRAALAMRPSVHVDDVETAAPETLNREFERKTFGHRALIHAHIQQYGQLWGILQPCVFGQPRHWTENEKTQIEAMLPRLQPVIAAYVE